MGLISQEAGLAFLVAVGVYGFLFVNPKSPIRKRFWHNSSLNVSPSGNLDFGLYENHTLPKNRIRGSKVLRGSVNIVSLKGEIVDTMVLKLRKGYLESDWQPRKLDLSDCVGVKFFVPDSIKPGKYVCHIIVSNKNGKAKSEEFEVEIPANWG